MAGSTRIVELAAQALLRLAETGEVNVTCSSGAVWITRDGNCNDTVLEDGQACLIRGKGVIIEAVRPATLVIETRRVEFPLLRFAPFA